MPHELGWGTPSELQRTTQWDAHEPGHGKRAAFTLRRGESAPKEGQQSFCPEVLGVWPTKFEENCRVWGSPQASREDGDPTCAEHRPSVEWWTRIEAKLQPP